MQQLAFLDIHLDKRVRRKAEKLMSSYTFIDAIIQSQKLDLPEQSMIVNYHPSEIQRGNQFHSETERVALLMLKISEHIKTKEKLDNIYKSLKPIQRRIWDLRYIEGKTDVDVYNEFYISDRTYYRVKREMIAVIAEAFRLS